MTVKELRDRLTEIIDRYEAEGALVAWLDPDDGLEWIPHGVSYERHGLASTESVVWLLMS